jgi:hypothetical protein
MAWGGGTRQVLNDEAFELRDGDLCEGDAVEEAQR